MTWAVFALGGIIISSSWRLEKQERLAWNANQKLEVEKASSLSLLQNVFPAPIADRLLNSNEPIADRYDSLIVVFADLVGFTSMSRTMSAPKLVEHLDRLFTDFDAIVREHHYTKVKTIGDAYMAVGGLDWDPKDNRTIAGAKMAWDLMTCAKDNHDVQLRIGIHIGPAVAGVIGRERFIYDFWGDTVNLASRLESFGLPGRIHISEAVVKNFNDVVKVEIRGIQELKGVGSTVTYWLSERPKNHQLNSNNNGHLIPNDFSLNREKVSCFKAQSK